jgi:amino acid transporter
MGNSMAQIYLKFCASLHHYYARRDSTPWVFVLFTSTILIGFNILFAYDFSQFYFLSALRLKKEFALLMFIIIGLMNFLFVIRKGKYKEIYPSKTFNLGVIAYILISAMLMIFIALKYRASM